MLKKNLSYLILIGFLVTSSRADAQKVWIGYGVDYRMGENITACLQFENRYLVDGELSNYKNFAEIALKYKLSPYFRLGGSYRFTLPKSLQDDINDEEDQNERQRYCIDLRGKLPLDRFSLKNRSRYQISLKNDEGIKRFYRNETCLDIHIDKRTEFYLSNEFFYRIDKHKITRDIIGFGFDRLKIMFFQNPITIKARNF